MICPHCQRDNPDTARFCSNCGQELARRCPSCQTEYPQGAHFCMACGQPLRGETHAETDLLSRLASEVPGTLEQKIRSASTESAARRRGALGERRTVTALLVDVVGSTALADELDLETWMKMMNQAFDRIAAVIYQYEGTIARLLGDSLLAFFGAPVAHEDDPQRAVRAGLELIDLMGKYSQEIKKTYGLEFAVRVCINTGPVEVGPIGKDLTYEYTAFGGTVNLTSRIKFAGAPMGILITGNTYPFVAPFFDCLDLGAIEVKGLKEAVRVYQVRATKREAGQVRGITGLSSPMIGRSGELSILLHLCEAVRAGMGRAVVILGEPGMGKTRLIQEWQIAAQPSSNLRAQSADKSPGIRWVFGHCVSYGQALAYQLLIDVVRNLIGVSEASDEPETHRALLAFLDNLLGEQMMEVYPYLGHLLSLKLEGEAFLRAQISDPLALQNLYRMAMEKLLSAYMQQNPLILILEDLHWADASSIEIFTRMVPDVMHQPILLCLVARPEHGAAGWRLITAARERMGSSLSEISLSSLTEKDSHTLVANLLEIETLPKRVRDLILRKAEGNPYFVEEVIRMLIDRGIVFHRDGAWVAQGEISEHDIPDNLQGLLLARIDRLPSDARQNLLVASVIGRNFPVKVLSSITKNPRSLFNDLGILENAGLIQIAGAEPDLEYTFRHSLVQDAAYDLLLEKDCKQLHLEVGEVMERLYPERRIELAAILGYHFDQAGQEERALNYFFIAGENALASSANQEAENQYRQALHLTCPSKAERARLYTGLGEALSRQDRFDESTQAYYAGLDIYKSIGDYDGIAQLYALIGRIIWFLDEAQKYLHICLEGMNWVKDAPGSVGKATLIHETARAYRFSGMHEEALPLCRQALALAKQFGAVNEQADALATLGILDVISLEERREALEQAVQLAEANGLFHIAARAHNNLGNIYSSWQPDYQAAMVHFKRSAELGKLRGSASEESFGMLNYFTCLVALGKLAEIEAELPHVEELVGRISSSAQVHETITMLKGFLIGCRGDWDTGLSAFRQTLESARRNKYPERVLTSIEWLSMLSLERQAWGEPTNLDEVISLLQEAVQIVEGSREFDRVWIYPRMSTVYVRQGQLDQARLWLKKARQEAEKTPSAWDEIYLGICEAEIAYAEHDWSKALTETEKVVTVEQRLGHPVLRLISSIHWADILMHRGEPADLEQAQTILSQTIEEFNRMGMGYFPQVAEKLLRETQSRLHTQALDHQQMTRELKKARQVQESMLPEKPPEIPGWQLAVSLEPAHETSGDFYDFLPFGDGSLGLVIADVTDKGTGAALYMALSRSLWRTFARNHPAEPELTMAETNQRILADTHGGLFITLFYGILNPTDGSLTYCSAGHHPAFLVRAKDGSMELLERTGVPLGVFEEASWDRLSVEIEPGDVLVLYTDGITDAQNQQEEFYGLERLKKTVSRLREKPAPEVHRALLAEVHDWIRDTPQYDDTTLMVFTREQ